MPFSDYSSTPASNTTIGDGIYIGPDMDRNNVRPALQTLAADGRMVYDLLSTTALTGNYYSVVAEGAAATVAPSTFVSDESGAMSLYDHAGALLVKDIFGITASALDIVALPPTTSPSTGVVTKGGTRFIHDFNDGTNVGGTIGQNTFMGMLAGNFTLSGVANTCVGYESGTALTSASLTTMFGTRAGKSVTSGGVNSGFGTDALATCTTGEYNDGFGCKALTNTTTGSRNKAFGQSSLLYNTTGSDNCAFGQETLIANLTGLRLNAFGNFSQYTSTAASDVCSFGTNSLRNNTGNENCAFGNRALFTNGAGTLNVAIGYDCAYFNTTGDRLTAIGPYALYGNTTGDDNTALGFRAGYGQNAGDEATTVDTNCTFLGSYSSRDNSVPTATPLTNSTAIGAYARFTKSNQVVIGHTTVTETVLRGVQQSTVYTVATLPTGAVGMRAFVSDATSATFGDTAAGTGSNKVPVFHDGTNWRVG